MPSAIASMKLKDFPSWGLAAAKLGIKLTNDDLKDSFSDQNPDSNPSVNVALETYFKNKDRTVVDAAIARIIRSSKIVKESDTLKKRKQAAQASLGELLAWLVDQLDTLSPPKEIKPNAKVVEVLGQAAVDELQALRLYACNDASTFTEQIAKGMGSQVLNRQWAANKDDARVQAYGMTLGLGRKPAYEASDLEKVRANVEKGRLAICTTFAMTAGDILAKARAKAKTKFRIELVGASNHCFVLVNRTGELDAKKKVAKGNDGSWGDKVIIIDAWAASLGHPVFAYGTKEYPKELGKYLAELLVRTYELNE